MKRNFKYSLVLSATLALSFCQGRHSSVFDPTQGANMMTAQQLLNTPVENRSLPFGADRPQRLALSYTPEQANACIESLKTTGTFSTICNQILYDYYYKIYGPGFENFIPDNTQIAYNGNNVDFDWRGSFNNQPWIPQYQQQMGQNYRTPMDMHRFCQDPSYITTMQYSNPCGRMNWNYATITVDNNRGYNYMRQGDFKSAAPYFGPQGLLQRRAPLLYGTVLSHRDVGKENKALTKQVESSWTNMKQLPKNTGLRLLNRVMDVPASMLERIVSGYEAKLSTVSANNYADAAYSQQVTNNNDYVANAYYDMTRASQYSTLNAMQPDNPCPEEKFFYKIGDESTGDNQYRVISCGE